MSSPLTSVNYRHIALADSDVTTSSQVIFTPEAGDKVVIIQNISDEVIYLKFSGEAAVVGEGIRLKVDDSPTFYCPKNKIAAIHGGSGSKQLLITVGK